MKKLQSLSAAVLFLSVFVGAGEVIKNPAQPSHPQAGRILDLKEEIRITDESGSFFFQYPRNVQVAPDESIYFMDRDQLIHLDKNGRFLHNLFKKGQGPGELNYLSNYVVTADGIIANGVSPGKLLFFGFNGALRDEISLQGFSSRLELLFVLDDLFYFVKRDFPRTEKSSEIMGWPHVICSLSGAMDVVKELENFPIETLVMDGAAVSNVNFQAALLGNNQLCVVHTAEYLIRVLDIRTGDLVGDFSRKYKRVKKKKEQGAAAIIMGDKRYEAPGSDTLQDIRQIFPFRDLSLIHI